MCLLCGETSFGRHSIAITERPAQRLAGLWWDGTYAEAARGATRECLKAVQTYSDDRDALWKSPIVGLSWSLEGERLRYFCGMAIDADDMVARGFATVDLPEMRFAGSWHGPDDGDVLPHLSRILEWLRREGWSRDHSRFHQREEYAADVDLSAPPSLRLLLPVTTATAVSGAPRERLGRWRTAMVDGA